MMEVGAITIEAEYMHKIYYPQRHYNTPHDVTQCYVEKLVDDKDYTQLISTNSILEVSTRSTNRLGRGLSAFNIMFDGKPLECIYQHSKFYVNNATDEIIYDDYDGINPVQAKKNANSLNKKYGKHIGFYYKNKYLTIDPPFYFYDWLYAVAFHSLFLTAPTLSDELEMFTGYTDMFQRKEPLANSQARSLAVCLTLNELNKLETFVKSPKEFKSLYL